MKGDARIQWLPDRRIERAAPVGPEEKCLGTAHKFPSLGADPERKLHEA